VNLGNAHKGATKRECRCACEDFRKLFNENAQSLYLLSFLLCANHEKAEKCLVEGLMITPDETAPFSGGLIPGAGAS
jgi:hypothetical protein